MSYITRNANLILLFLIFIIASTLVSATLFFQNRFSNINEEYDSKLAELKNVTAQVESYREVLQKAQVELELKQSREEQFTEKYTEAKQTSDALAVEKSSLEQQLVDATQQLAAKSNQITDLSSQVSALSAQLNTQKSLVNNLQNDIDDLEDEVDCLQSTADSLEGNC